MRETLVSSPSRSTVDSAVTAVRPGSGNGVNHPDGRPSARRHPPHPKFKRRQGYRQRLERAKGLVVEHQRTGRHWLARELGASFSEAGRILGDLESQGVVGPSRFGRNGRAILVEAPQASKHPARAKARRRRSAHKPRASSNARCARILPDAVPQALQTELLLSTALGMAELPQHIVGLRATAKLLDRLYGGEKPRGQVPPAACCRAQTR